MTVWNWFSRASLTPEPVDALEAQWARVTPSHAEECDWRARVAAGDREPLPAHMTWLHPAAG